MPACFQKVTQLWMHILYKAGNVVSKMTPLLTVLSLIIDTVIIIFVITLMALSSLPFFVVTFKTLLNRPHLKQVQTIYLARFSSNTVGGWHISACQLECGLMTSINRQLTTKNQLFSSHECLSLLCLCQFNFVLPRCR